MDALSTQVCVCFLLASFPIFLACQSSFNYWSFSSYDSQSVSFWIQTKTQYDVDYREQVENACMKPHIALPVMRRLHASTPNRPRSCHVLIQTYNSRQKVTFQLTSCK